MTKLKIWCKLLCLWPMPDKNKIIYNSADYPLPEMQKDADIENEKIEALKEKSKQVTLR